MSKNDHHRKKRETLRHRRQRKKMLHGLKLRPYHFRSHKTYNAVSLKFFGINRTTFVSEAKKLFFELFFISSALLRNHPLGSKIPVNSEEAIRNLGMVENTTLANYLKHKKCEGSQKIIKSGDQYLEKAPKKHLYYQH